MERVVFTADSEGPPPNLQLQEDGLSSIHTNEV